jgi:hypothetical protein
MTLFWKTVIVLTFLLVAPEFLYDPASRKVLFRSAVLREVNDISELRLGRAPGEYPNEIDFNRPIDHPGGNQPMSSKTTA